MNNTKLKDRHLKLRRIGSDDFDPLNDEDMSSDEEWLAEYEGITLSDDDSKDITASIYKAFEASES
ncbi:hypothetical protein TIFTF001_026678 [Ficus carica]|uniref:Uncharacterized protein n=1 Tax=Ficus carica TaxID=3494 RepID=A0AA88ITU3_FICCA|nr:hypothetical protein TIFTF001_026678 [Ficus carica]